MKADTLDLTQLFANPVRYLVPIFQRPYIWNQDLHWGPLWEDVRGVAESALKRQTRSDGAGEVAKEVPPHFLGAIVLDQVLNPTGTVQARYVIDGQQRLTTLQLFLSAAREVAVDHSLDKPATTLTRLLLNPEDLLDESGSEQRFKVWPTLRDQPAFVAVMDHHGQLPTDGGHSGHRMAYAERFFHESISAWLAGDDLKHSEDPDERMKALMGVITRMLKVVVIDLEPNDNAQVIFETLNARGTPLLASDLVKNLVFQRASEDGANLQSLYDAHWRPFDTDDWRHEIRQGRLNRPRVEVFLFHWLTMRTEDEVGASRLFQTFKSVLDTSEQPVAEVLAEFAGDGKVFDSFDQQPYGTPAQRFFYRLDVLDTTTLLPIALWLFRQPATVLDHDARLRAMRVLESWLVRRMICRLTTKNYNRFFLDLLPPLKEAPSQADELLWNKLREEKAESQYWPGDAQFRDALTSQPHYGSITQRRVRMLLLAFEDHLRAEAKLGEQIPAGTNFHIEHVLPQSWQENWPLSDGAPDGAAEDRDIAKHKLGNLTLVTSSLNPSMSNGSWDTKKYALDEHSLLMLNRQILKGDPPDWNEQSIAERGARLAEAAVMLWPGPDAEFPTSFSNA